MNRTISGVASLSLLLYISSLCCACHPVLAAWGHFPCEAGVPVKEKKKNQHDLLHHKCPPSHGQGPLFCPVLSIWEMKRSVFSQAQTCPPGLAGRDPGYRTGTAWDPLFLGELLSDDIQVQRPLSYKLAAKEEALSRMSSHPQLSSPPLQGPMSPQLSRGTLLGKQRHRSLR